MHKEKKCEVFKGKLSIFQVRIHIAGLLPDLQCHIYCTHSEFIMFRFQITKNLKRGGGDRFTINAQITSH